MKPHSFGQPTGNASLALADTQLAQAALAFINQGLREQDIVSGSLDVALRGALLGPLALYGVPCAHSEPEPDVLACSHAALVGAFLDSAGRYRLTRCMPLLLSSHTEMQLASIDAAGAACRAGPR